MPQLRHWEKKLQAPTKENSVEKLCALSQDQLRLYRQHLDKQGMYSKTVQEQRALMYGLSTDSWPLTFPLFVTLMLISCEETDKPWGAGRRGCFYFWILDKTIYYKYWMTFSLLAIVNVVIWHSFYSKATGMSWYWPRRPLVAKGAVTGKYNRSNRDQTLVGVSLRCFKHLLWSREFPGESGQVSSH